MDSFIDTVTDQTINHLLIIVAVSVLINLIGKTETFDLLVKWVILFVEFPVETALVFMYKIDKDLLF